MLNNKNLLYNFVIFQMLSLSICYNDDCSPGYKWKESLYYENSYYEDECVDINECMGANSCNQICENTEGSYRCKCNKGYRLNKNQRTCEDINECEEGEFICDHTCINTPGSFQCKCGKDYQLMEDQMSCKGKEVAVLIFVNGSNIEAKYLNHSVAWTVAKLNHTVTSMGFHPLSRRVYYTSGDQLYFKQITGKSQPRRLDFEGLKIPTNLVIDWFGNNIYMTDSQNKGVIACNIRTKSCSQVIYLEGELQNLQMDLEKKFLFWYNITNNTIERAGLDGTGKIVVVDNITSSTFALYLAYEKLFWYESDGNSLQYSDYGGENRKTLNATITSEVHDFKIVNGLIHMAKSTNDSKEGVFSCRIRDCKDFSPEVLFNGNEKEIKQIIIHQPPLLPNDKNPCHSTWHHCSHQCLLSPTTELSYVCRCPVGHKIHSDQHTCKNKCDEENGGCQQHCKFHRGNVSCTCDSGFRLGEDLKACEDVNECLNVETCHHLCSNNVGSYVCKCAEGFELDHDRTTCIRTDGSKSVFGIIDGRNISLLEGVSHLSNELKLNATIPEDVDLTEAVISFDSKEGVLYVLDAHRGILFERRDDSSWQKQRVNLTHIFTAEFDHPNKNLYLVTQHHIHNNESSTLKAVVSRIKVYNIVNHKLIDLISVPFKHIVALRIASHSNKMITCECGFYCNLVLRNNLGKKIKTLAEHEETHQSSWKSLVFDNVKHRVLWTDMHSSFIKAINTDVYRPKILIQNKNISMHSLAYSNNHLFYISGNQTLVKFSLHKGRIEERKNFKRNIFLLNVEEYFETEGNETCMNDTCSHVCIPEGKTPRCFCSEDFHPVDSHCWSELQIKELALITGDCDDDPCVHGTCVAASWSTSYCKCFENYIGVLCEIYSESVTANPSGVVGWVLFGLLLIVVAGLLIKIYELHVIVFAYLRQRLPDNVQQHFENPSFSKCQRQEAENNESEIETFMCLHGQEMDEKSMKSESQKETDTEKNDLLKN